MNNRELLVQINRLMGASYTTLRDISIRRLLLLTIALLLTWFDAQGIDPADPDADSEISKIWRHGE